MKIISNIVGILWVLSILVVYGLYMALETGSDFFGWTVSNTTFYLAIGVQVILAFYNLSGMGRSRYSYLDDLSQQQRDDEGDGGGGE